MKYFKKNMHYLLVTLYLFSSQINAFSFDNNNDLNIGIPISEKTYTNKTYENPENKNLTFPADAGNDEDICFGDPYQIGVPGDQSLFNYSWTSSPLDDNFDDDIPNPTVFPNVTTTYTLTVEEISSGTIQTDEVIVTIIEVPIDAGSDATICEGDSTPIGETPEAGYSYSWTSTPTDLSLNPSIANPSVSPIETTTYTLTKTSIPLGCSDSETVTVTVEELPDINAGTNATICENQIDYSLISASGPPSGVSYSWTSSGNGTFSNPNLLNPIYTIGPADAGLGSITLTLSAVNNPNPGNCDTITDQITLTVNSNDELSLSSAVGTDSQVLCETESLLTSIIYDLSGGATNATVTGLPNGVTAAVTSNQLTISGTPSAGITTTQTYSYTVTTSGPCASVELFGTITVNPDDALALTSAVGTNSQELCDSESLDTIVYQFSEGATDANVSGLPAGVNALFTGNDITISGTPPAATGAIQVYPYTITTVGTCNNVSLSGTITIEALLSVSAGANGAICETGYLLNSAAVSNEDSVLWTSSGDGTFNNSSSTVTTYTPGTNDKNLGSVDLTLRATNDCGFEEDTITKTIAATPSADAGTDITISQGATANLSGTTTNASSILWTVTSGNGTLANPTSEIAQYISDPAEVGPVTLTLTAQPITVNGSPCGTADSSSLTIFINLPPTANAGPDGAICLNGTTQLGVASTPGYSYQWASVPNDPSISNPTSSNPNVSPSVTTEYTVTVTDTNGETAEDSVIVTVNPLPVADAGTNDSICETDSFVLGIPAQGGFSYAWTSIPAGFSSTQADPTVTPNSTTQYFLTVTNNTTNCQSQDNVTISVEELPVINAGTDETICEGTTTYTLASASGPTSGVSFQWEALGGNGTFSPNANALNPTYTLDPTDSGTITFKLIAENIAGGCPPVSENTILTIENSVIVSAGADGSICETGYLLNSATASNQNSVLWTSSGDGTFNNPSSLVTTYTPGTSDKTLGSVDLTLRATNDCGFEEDTITKTIAATPSADAGTDITISQGATANLSGITTNASSILWTVTSGNGTLVNPTSEIAQYISDPSEVGPVTLALTAQPITVNGSPCGTADSSSLTIFINLPPTADAGPDRAICLNEVTTIGSASNPVYNYEWVSVPNDPSISNPNSSNPNVSPFSNYRIYRNGNRYYKWRNCRGFRYGYCKSFTSCRNW